MTLGTSNPSAKQATTVSKADGLSDRVFVVDDLQKWTFYTSAANGVATFQDRKDLVNKLLIKADDTTIGSRPSVRVQSPWRFGNPGSWFAFTLVHQPADCGVWPALWLRGRNDENGNWDELDLVESIHNNIFNIWNIHTRGLCYYENMNCTYPPPVGRSGNVGCQKPVGEFPSVQNPYRYNLSFSEQTVKFTQNEQPLFEIERGCTTFNDMQVIISIDFCGRWSLGHYDKCSGNLGYPSQGCQADIFNNVDQVKQSYWEFTAMSALPNDSTEGGARGDAVTSGLSFILLVVYLLRLL